MKIINQVVNVDGVDWMIIEAVNMEQAHYAIGTARCCGSVGSKHTVESGGVTTVQADVMRKDKI